MQTIIVTVRGGLVSSIHVSENLKDVNFSVLDYDNLNDEEIGEEERLELEELERTIAQGKLIEVY